MGRERSKDLNMINIQFEYSVVLRYQSVNQPRLLRSLHPISVIHTNTICCIPVDKYIK